MEQLILHLIGDYITQSDWMANGKTSKYLPAMVHATVYSLPFLLLRPSWIAFSVILITHFFIDRFRLAKYVVYAKNFIGTPHWNDGSGECGCKLSWADCSATGYPSKTPPFLAIWLMIIADNTMHLSINYLSLRFL